LCCLYCNLLTLRSSICTCRCLRMGFRNLSTSLFILLSIYASPSWALKPVEQSASMKMGEYVSFGPVRDSAHPELAFPVFDLFSPNGNLVYHAGSVEEIVHFLKHGHLAHSHPPSDASFQADTLSGIAKRYPNIGWQTNLLLGRYTLLFINASGCEACELQRKPMQHAALKRKGLNLVILTLAL